MFTQLLLATVPALIVAFTAHYTLKLLLNKQERQRQLQLSQARQETTLPLRLQALERLSLFCERISLQNLLSRTNAVDRSAAEFRAALLLSIQQEYEHNITQQVYVSQNLWEIIKAGRDDLSEMITLAADAGGDGQAVARRLLAMAAERGADPLQTAQAAIRREAGSLF
jgi:hypothetical protein